MTITVARPAALTVARPADEPSPNLFFRRNEFHSEYRPVSNHAHAEWLLGSTTFDSPWVTVVRGAVGGDSIYFQVLGTPDRLIAEGGGVLGHTRWDWRATAVPGDYRPTTVGPPWYKLDVYQSDVITVHDARRMLWFALAGDLTSMRSRTGMEALRF